MRVDLLHLSRHLRRSPISALAAVVTIALTLGAAASIFAIVDAVLLTPPPFANPDALFTVGEVPIDERAAAAQPTVSYATFEAWRDRARSLASFEAFDGTNLTLTEIGLAERVRATDVTPGFLGLLGVSPVMGRTFAADDVGRPVAIISHTFWRGKLGGDPNIIGREIVLGNRSHTVIGVLPEQFVFALGAADIWRPFSIAPAQAALNGVRVLVIARLNPTRTPAQVAEALDDVSRASRQPARVLITSVATAIAGNRTTTLTLLSGAVGLAMVIAFANLAGLLLVRSIDRRRELAVRTALGAPPPEIARQLVIESFAIVALGTIGGVLLAWWMTPAAANLVLERIPGQQPIIDVAISWRVLGGLTLLACICACVCGSLPALSASRWNIVEVLRRGVTPSAHELGVRRAFVVGEVTVAFVLLVSMSLLGRSLFNLLDVNPGFDARGVMALQVSLPGATYSTAERSASFYSTLQAVLSERLGARATAVIDELPLTGDRGRRLVGARPGAPGREAIVRSASPGYFEVMHIPVVAGRSFEPTDSAAVITPRVVISQSLANQVFGSESPVGRQIWLVQQALMADVIGVVGDVKHRSLDETPLPTVYRSSLQEPSNSSVVVVRSSRPAADVITVVREEVDRLDSKLPVYRARPMEEVVAASPGLPARRLLTAAFTAFALLAVVLSMIGLFGVAAHDVACRRTELMLRMALGAHPMSILRTTLGRGVVTVAIGVVLGGLLSIWAVNALSGVIFHTGHADVLSIGLALLVLIAAGVGAVLPAALRASRTDPRTVLYGE
jgi:putative ABC transport system permease protein